MIERFDPARLEKGRLFRDSIEENLQIVFHGTSSEHRASIEKEGFLFDRHPVRRDDIDRVIAVFDAMEWAGQDTGGYVVLKSFSSHDFGRAQTSPIYFAESSVRALTFASEDFAGGEKLRGIRRAIADLELYWRDESVRHRHRKKKEQRRQEMMFLPAYQQETKRTGPVSVDLEWLRNEIVRLSDLKEASNVPLREYCGGSVYAVRLLEEDLSKFEYHDFMGIKAWASIPSNRIVARIDIDRHVKLSPFLDIDPSLELKRIDSDYFQRMGAGTI